MAKEVLLYGSIYSYSAIDFINALEAAKNDDIVVRINTNGGSVEDAWSGIAKFSEHKKNKIVRVDGKAYSMGLFFLCYCDQSECFDISQFLLHRAAYSTYMEKSPDMTEDAWSQLNAINAKLRAALEAKIDVKKFEKLKGYTLDQIFSNDNRIDVTLTADEARAIGLVNNVIQITPEKVAEINANNMRIAAEATGVSFNVSIPENKKPSTMTLEELKANHPAIFAEAVKVGVTQERDRVGSFLAFIDIDPVACSKGIKEGEVLTQTAMAEFARKGLSKKSVAELEKEGAAAVATTEPPVVTITDEQKQEAEFEASVRAELGLTNKK